MTNIPPTTARSHIERSRELVDLVRTTAGRLTTSQILHAAQIHALLALAETQRTANMIASAQGEHAVTDEVLRRVDD